MTLARTILTALYWLGVALVLVGVALRFYAGMAQMGLTVALLGAGLILAARVNSMLRPRPPLRPPTRDERRF